MNRSDTATREHVLGEVRALVNEGKLSDALQLIAASGIKDAELANAAGVCHLRAGRPERAVDVFRELCVGEGVGVKPDASPLHVVNFATALLLTRNLSGCRHMLRHLGASPHPAAIRLRTALTTWEHSLGRWRRLGLKLGLWEPRTPIDLGFPPGALQ